MKVMCIDDKMEVKDGFIKGIPPQPYFGDVDEVISDGIWTGTNEEYYCLLRFGKGIGYTKNHFAPLSEINELELVNTNEELNLNNY